ncbi:cytochrome P450 [Kitasatospora sp. NPDC015120]|uniref:cytochrome P450 family protein n=1 Tax=Kitasatospora sp. NPDC015120 TaxID=3364023 RepID=UPI0036F46F20
MAPDTAVPTEPLDLASFGPRMLTDPYPVLAELRERGPAHRVRLFDGSEAWLIVSYPEARAALADPRFRKDWSAADPALRKEVMGDGSEGGSRPKVGRHMLSADPPDHTRLRNLVSRAFTPRRIERLRPTIQRTTDDLLDAMLPQGRADLLDALAYPLSMAVICELLGVPVPDQEQFRRWSGYLVVNDRTPAAAEAAQRFHAYLRELVAAKRESPGSDVLSALIQVQDDDGDRLSEEELHATTLLLLLAGHETTLNMIGNAVLSLLRHPDQLAALRADWSLIDGAIAESLRYQGPLKTASVRFAAEEVRIGDTVIPADGSPVLVALAAADRDPGRYQDPDRFDITRNTTGHLAFGHGVHYCLGAPLARLEGAVVVRSLLERCPDLALDVPVEELGWRGGIALRGMTELPVRFTPVRG